MNAKEYYKSTRLVPTMNWTLEMTLSFAEEYANQSRWISCSEKLPEANQEVLILTDYTEYGRPKKRIDIASVHFAEENIRFGGPNSLSGQGFLKGIYFAIPAILNPDVVKFWQPLPETP